AVQTAGNLVALVVELSACVQHREHNFRRRLSAFVLVNGNTAAVVDNGDRSVGVNGDIHLVGEAGQRLVNGVVDDFVHEVMQPGRTSRPDVHGWTFPYSLEPFEDLDLVR